MAAFSSSFCLFLIIGSNYKGPQGTLGEGEKLGVAEVHCQHPSPSLPSAPQQVHLWKKVPDPLNNPKNPWWESRQMKGPLRLTTGAKEVLTSVLLRAAALPHQV